MNTLKMLLSQFFTHKDFLPPPEQWPGTLFTPMQIIFCTIVGIGIITASFSCSKKNEKIQKKLFLVLWLLMLISEPLIVLWDAMAGAEFRIEWASAMSLWPCSLFLYTAPFAIFGKGNVRKSACGYICTLGLLGGIINFVYPANYLSRYSCLSMAGFRTIFYHGAMVFTALTMLLSGYHSFKDAQKRTDFILPLIPCLLISIPAHIVNALIPEADYMFFKMQSFFFAPIGAALPGWLTAILVYFIYAIIHVTPYLVFWFSRKNQRLHTF